VEQQTISPKFTYATAIGYEEGVTRRDPSPVLKHGDLFYAWYSRSAKGASGYHASVWYATSPDGHEWTEQGEAIPKGGEGSWDENGVFTPTTLVEGGKWYLFYTAVPKPFTNDNGGSNATPTGIGVAVADHPQGPWHKLAGNPLIRPSDNPDDFDSHRVDDACLIIRGGKYWLYYKGRKKGFGAADTKTGLAVADQPTGPYAKHPLNPIIPSGHEVCVFPFGEGVAALVSPAGPQGNTLQYSTDGLTFKVMETIAPPSAPGPFRTDRYQEGFGPGITWGLCQHTLTDWPYLLRFECDIRPEDGNKG
jgi:beta-xylosidase